MSLLFEPARLGKLTLNNHMVMAPMTRCRALGNVPNALMAEYYAQRAGIGLLITEGTSPSPNGLGYANIPGIFSAEQVEGWKLVTKAVHDKGGKIFIQLMHTGRIGHPANMPEGAEIVAPSAIQAAGEMFTMAQGPQPHPTPRAMTLDDIRNAQQEYIQAAKNAIEAGFDGVELHGANGYLIDQFLSGHSNRRTDEYGGSVENRIRFAVETAQLVGQAIGFDKTAIRFSPYGVNGDQQPYEGEHETFVAVAKEMNRLGLVYVHLVDHSAMGAPAVDPKTVAGIREAFTGTLILCGNYDRERAEAALASKQADLVAFGRPALANPDLVERLQAEAPLNQPDFSTFYTPFAEGYTTYPTLAAVSA